MLERAVHARGCVYGYTPPDTTEGADKLQYFECAFIISAGQRIASPAGVLCLSFSLPTAGF